MGLNFSRRSAVNFSIYLSNRNFACQNGLGLTSPRPALALPPSLPSLLPRIFCCNHFFLSHFPSSFFSAIRHQFFFCSVFFLLGSRACATSLRLPAWILQTTTKKKRKKKERIIECYVSPSNLFSSLYCINVAYAYCWISK